MTTTLSYSDTCALPPIDRVRHKVAELGLRDHMHVIDELFALEAESVRETQLHLTRLGIGAYVIGDADDAFASLELLVTFLVGMTGAEMMADFKKKTGMSLAEATSKYTCKNC